MKKKTAVIASSVAAIALCSSIVAGSTFALFTSESQVNIAVTSATVDVTATIGTVSTTGLNGVAMVEANVVGNNVELNNIAPGDKVSFNITVENNSSIEVQYRTKIKCVEGEALMSELVFTVGETDYSGLVKYVSDWEMWSGADSYIIPVTIELPEEATDCQGISCVISYSVEAVQGNASMPVEPDRDWNLFKTNYDGEGIYTVSGLKDGAAPSELLIPAEYEGVPVVISEGAFYGSDTLESVTINCAKVPSNAFSACTNLKEVVFEEGVEVIGSCAFDATEGEYVGGGCYEDGESNQIEKIHIPASVTTISSSAFENCANLQEVTFAEDCRITEIGYYAFSNCHNLESIVLPDSVTSVGSGIFSGCDKLKNVTMPKGVMPENTETKAMSKDDYFDYYIKNVDKIVEDVKVVEETINLSALEEIVREAGLGVGFYEMKQAFFAQYDSVEDMLDKLGEEKFAYVIGFFHYYDSADWIACELPESYGITGEELQVIFDGIEGMVDYRYIGWLYYAFNGSTGDALAGKIKGYLSADNVDGLYSKYLEATGSNKDLGLGYMLSGCGSLETITFNGNMDEWNTNLTADYLGVSYGCEVTVICNDGSFILK